MSDLTIGKAEALGFARGQIAFDDVDLVQDNFKQLCCCSFTISSICLKNQRSIFVSSKTLLHIPAFGEGLAEEEDALRVRHGELGGERLVIDFLVGTIADEAEAFDLQTAQAFCRLS
jgi:hypothetical protein